MKKIFFLFTCFSIFFSAASAQQASVTLVDNGKTVTMNNGIVEVTITKNSGDIKTFVYNGDNILARENADGKFYWSWNMPGYQNPKNCSYTLTADPANNNFSYAEIKLHMAWSGSAKEAAMDVDIYYSLKKNVSGVYAAAILTHPAAYPLNPGGEWRMSSYPGTTFDWMSVDSSRNFLMASKADYDAALPVPRAPKEVSRFTSGIYTNQYECKYDYSADIGDLDAWGWSSTQKNIGIWMTVPSKEYYPGGPMKRELICHGSPTLLNMIGGTHYNTGGDGTIAAGEDWQKVYGPFLIYCNKVPMNTTNAAMALWQDAKLQAKKEQAQWPYDWFTESKYIKAAGRGKVTGKLIINDRDHPSVANIWVGLAIAPAYAKSTTDFQQWSKNYQFWVRTDWKGNFSIPDVLPGTYNLYTFGPGVAGQMTKKNFTTVSAGAITALGNVVWTTDRIAPTVWEIGVPDRTAAEFKHGNDWWMRNSYPDSNWAKFMDYKNEFPNGVTYTVGKSNYATDWNFVQPYLRSDSTPPEWKIKFDLANDPTATTNASLYVAAASAFAAPLFIKLNGTEITGTTTGINFPILSNAMIRKGIHGAFADLRFTFPANLLHSGSNELSLIIRKPGGDIQYDYIRLEAEGTKVK